jgi:hypothetical protein
LACEPESLGLRFNVSMAIYFEIRLDEDAVVQPEAGRCEKAAVSKDSKKTVALSV